MTFEDIWSQIREKFPPARAVALLTPIVLPLIAYVNTWVADHAPWIDQYVGQDERMGIFVGTIAAGVALAYKWLDGRAKWEQSQVAARVALVQADKLPPEAALEPVTPTGDVTDVGTQTEGLDDDALLSQPADIAESDADPPDALERRERVELEEPQ